MAILLLCSTQLIKLLNIQFPLFFAEVKTKVKYMVVGSFVIQEETRETTAEAMDILRSWNDSWNPVCFVADKHIELMPWASLPK